MLNKKTNSSIAFKLALIFIATSPVKIYFLVFSQPEY